MKNPFIHVTCAIVFLVLSSSAASAQQKSAGIRGDSRSAAGTVARGAGKVVVIVVGSAGEAAWVTTKFVGKNVAWPVAKTALVKAPEKAAVIGLKTVGFSLKKAIPAAGKIDFAYLKAKLP